MNIPTIYSAAAAILSHNTTYDLVIVSLVDLGCRRKSKLSTVIKRAKSKGLVTGNPAEIGYRLLFEAERLGKEEAWKNGDYVLIPMTPVNFEESAPEFPEFCGIPLVRKRCDGRAHLEVQGYFTPNPKLPLDRKFAFIKPRKQERQ